MAEAGTRPAGRTLAGWTALLTLAAATLGALGALALQPRLAPAAASCPHAGAHPHQASLAKLRQAIICLVNHQRSKRDRHLLERNKRLKLAAQRHNDTMLAQDCFRHRCADEPGLNHRVRKTGYIEGRKRFGFAEDLGYDNTPRQMVRRWLHTGGFNRRSMLNPDFRDLGVGVGWGTPVADLDDSKFATYTIVFGWRKP
jgi:uncharacterized protein YkwD